MNRGNGSDAYEYGAGAGRRSSPDAGSASFRGSREYGNMGHNRRNGGLSGIDEVGLAANGRADLRLG